MVTPIMPSSPPGHRHGRGLLLLAIVASLSTAVTSVDSRWTRWNCSSLPPSPAPSPSSSSSTTNSTFWSNVVALLDALPSAAAPTGFASLSRGNGADRAFVRGICRGDTSPAHCATYLRSAALGIKSRCSSRRGAIWYDDGSTVTYPAPMMSSISYADTDESTSDEDKYRMIFHNVRVVSDKDAFAFERAYYSLIGLLTARVVNGSATPSPAPMFATGEAVYDSAVPNGTMYGLLQCMRDRTAAECDHCLQNSSQKLPRELYGNQGGVVLGYNCYLRMEIYPFYDLTLDAPPPLAPAPSAFIGQSGGKKGDNLTLAVALPVGTAALSAVVIVGVFLCRRKANRKKTPPAFFVRLNNSIKEEDIGDDEPDQFSLVVLRAATNNFSEENKLGEGGFGEVFKETEGQNTKLMYSF